MSKLTDLPPSNKNKGNTSPVKTKTHIYPRKNRWGIVWSDTPASGSRRNIISKKLGDKLIEEFMDGQSSIKLEKKYKIDNDTILKYIKSKLPTNKYNSITRINLIDSKLGDKLIEEFRDGQSSIQLEEKYKIDNDTILKYIKSKLTHQEFEEKKRVNQHDFNS